jgi:hypothetical protein
VRQNFFEAAPCRPHHHLLCLVAHVPYLLWWRTVSSSHACTVVYHPCQNFPIFKIIASSASLTFLLVRNCSCIWLLFLSWASSVMTIICNSFLVVSHFVVAYHFLITTRKLFILRLTFHLFLRISNLTVRRSAESMTSGFL